MVSVVLGAKVQNYVFDISDVDFNSLQGSNPEFTVSKNGDIVVSQSKSDYVVLSGSFDLKGFMTGNYDDGIKQLNAITVYDGGKIVYKASGLDMTGAELDSGSVFKDFLAEKGYGIKGNAYANDMTSAGRNDVVHGMSGNDTIQGMGGVDKLFGDQGADRLIGGQGNDFLTGGAGADIFEFALGDGKDLILDFQASGKGQDKIDLSDHSAVSSFADLDIQDAGKNVVITIGDDSITLKNVSEHDLSASDFIF